MKSKILGGANQIHQDCEDQYHPGQKVGKGVYCSKSINHAEKYAGICEINEQKFKTVFMLRVNPEAIRHYNCDSELWVVDEDEIRPYRILYKNIDV